jgi:predicted RNase H-like HicB family nuclease
MRNYFAIVFESPTGGFIIDFPDLPECVAFADSFEVARAAAACALADHIDELIEIGASVPRPSPYQAIRRDSQNIGCQVIPVVAIDVCQEALVSDDRSRPASAGLFRSSLRRKVSDPLTPRL